jgi:outer membrane lipoprotein SlyB
MLNVGLMISSVALVACESTGPQYSPGYSGYSGSPGYGSYYGTVEAVEVVRERGNSSGLGAVIGGVAGGLLGHQIGSGSGNTAATIGGAVGGAVVGNEIEKRRNVDETYRLRVRMDDGSVQTFTQDNMLNFRVGDRVRMDNGRIVLN